MPQDPEDPTGGLGGFIEIAQKIGDAVRNFASGVRVRSPYTPPQPPRNRTPSAIPPLEPRGSDHGATAWVPPAGWQPRPLGPQVRAAKLLKKPKA